MDDTPAIHLICCRLRSVPGLVHGGFLFCDNVQQPLPVRDQFLTDFREMSGWIQTRNDDAVGIEKLTLILTVHALSAPQQKSQ